MRLMPVNNFILESIWTLIPIFILFLIYIPVAKLLGLFGYNDYYSKVGNMSNYNIESYPKTLISEDYESWGYSGLMHYIHKVIFLKDKDCTISTQIWQESSYPPHWEKNEIIKVIGNQWYWMYEMNYDYHYGNFGNFDEEVLYSYMLDFEDYNIFNENYQNFGFLSEYGFEDSGINELDFYFFNNFFEDCSSFIRLLTTDFYIVIKTKVLYTFFITSYDVIHSWAIPSVGVKVDATPGRVCSYKIIFNEIGYYYGQCSELCGFLHGFMPICLKVTY